MTLMQASFVYDVVSENMKCTRSLGSVVYGTWAVNFDEINRKITVDYDASWLQESDIASCCRTQLSH